MVRIVFLCFLLLHSPVFFASTVDSTLKKKHIRKANRLFLEYEFRKALPLYMKALEKYPESFTLLYRTGICYYFLPSEKFKSLGYFEKANARMGMDTVPELYIYLARSYHRENNFVSALENYGQFLKFLQDDTEKKEIERSMEMCRNGLFFSKEPEDIRMINLGQSVNSAFPDYAPVLSPDENMLIFTSKREGSTGGRMTDDDYYYFEDVYYSKRVGKEQWKLSEKLDTAITRRRWLFGGVEYEKALNAQTINTKDHDASIAMSHDGNILFLYRKDDLWMSNRENGGWGKPRLMSPGINTLAHEPSLTLSFDQKNLFLVSERKGGYGGKDIYMTTLVNDSAWGPVNNLGEAINTPYDEESPYLMPDGKSLYFSSQGHNSVGGFDVFKSVFENGKWSKPRNLGFPLNSGTDDIFFIINADTSLGHFTTERRDGLGDFDIYAVSFIPTYVRVQFLACGPVPHRLLNTGFRIRGEYSQDTTVTSKDGIAAQAKIYNGKTYSIALLEKGLSDKPVPLNLPTIRGKEKMLVTAELTPILGKKLDTIGTRVIFYELLKDVPVVPDFNSNDSIASSDISAWFRSRVSSADSGLLKIYTREFYRDTTPVAVVATGKPLPSGSKDPVFAPMYFSFAKSGLSDEVKSELGKVYEYFKSDTSLKFRIEGYTDSKGSGRYNKSLSRKRANAVVAFLAAKGIPRNQMDAVGKGEDNPAFPNENPDGSDNSEGRMKNRRVEVNVIR